MEELQAEGSSYASDLRKFFKNVTIIVKGTCHSQNYDVFGDIFNLKLNLKHFFLNYCKRQFTLIP